MLLSQALVHTHTHTHTHTHMHTPLGRDDTRSRQTEGENCVNSSFVHEGLKEWDDREVSLMPLCDLHTHTHMNICSGSFLSIRSLYLWGDLPLVLHSDYRGCETFRQRGKKVSFTSTVSAKQHSQFFFFFFCGLHRYEKIQDAKHERNT